MTKEQEDSIEILKNTDISTIELAEITDLYTYSIAVKTVLSMLKEKDAKIEHLEEKRNNQKAELAILNEKQKEMNKLTNTVSSYEGMVKKEQKDNKKKDKIIDLYIDKLARDEFDDCCQECCRECERDYDTLSNCIKQYFERKAINNG